MAFTLDTWKHKAQEGIIALTPKLQRLGVKSVYAALCGAALLPVAQAAQRGDFSALMTAGAVLAGSAGAGLIANIAQGAKDEADAAEIVEQELQQPGLPEELDRMLLKLEAMEAAQSTLKDQDRQWFLGALRSELDKLGNLATYEFVFGVNFGRDNRIEVKGDVAGRDIYHVTHQYLDATRAALTADELARKLADYLQWLRNDCSEIAMRCTGETRILRPLTLARAFVHLNLAVQSLDDETQQRAEEVIGESKKGDSLLSRLLGLVRKPGREHLPPSPPQRGGGRVGGDTDDTDDTNPNLTTRELLALGAHIVLTGGPGNGKSTVLQFIALEFATALLESQPVGVAHSLSWPAGAAVPVPVLIPLARYATHLRSLSPRDDRTLTGYISKYLKDRQAAFGLPDDFFVQLIKHGTPVMLLLDGLDEAPDATERGLIASAIGDLANNAHAPMAVVTCRTAAYIDNATLSARRFTHAAVQPLTSEQIRDLIRNAYADLFNAAELDDKTNKLVEDIDRLERERRERMGGEYKPLVDSPLIVRMLVIVDYNDRTLPRERARLYERVIQNLLSPDYHRDPEVIKLLGEQGKRYLHMIQVLAFRMHCAGEKGKQIQEHALRAHLLAEDWPAPAIDDFVALTARRDMLLSERAGAYQFIHLTFQEYLAARYLAEVVSRRKGSAAIAAFLQSGALDGLTERIAPAPAHDSWWREATLLTAGYFEAGESAMDFVRALANIGASDPDLQAACLELAVAAYRERTDGDPAVADELAHAILPVFDREAALARARPILRVGAANALAGLGDLRFHDASLFHLPKDGLLGFIHILAGTFNMGTRKQDFEQVMKLAGVEKRDWKTWEDEINPRPETHVSAFYIARYPVTVAQFKAFVDDMQAREPDFKLRDESALRGLSTHPVRYVTWYEAMRYCDWLMEKIQEARVQNPDLLSPFSISEGSQFIVTLPSEAEWEYAARGPLTSSPPGGGTSSQRSGGEEGGGEGVPTRIFTWPDDQPDPDKANYDETGIGDVSPVGCFPRGQSPFGCDDLLGNVWEWTRSRFVERYPYQSSCEEFDWRKATDDERYALRGGSFRDYLRFARVALRGGDFPNVGGDFVGFRCVVRLHLS